MISIGTPYFPDRNKLAQYIDRIYENGWLTNNGPLVQELTARLEAYLGVENVLLVANGTLALQIAYRALGIQGEAVTTPFSFIATASSLHWEGIKPVFSDIDPSTFCLDPALVEKHLSERTTALVPVHVFGNACDVEALQTIADKHRLKLVYDAAHAFGVDYKGASLLRWGDAATLSFHATKLFHTAEGGAIVFKDRAVYEQAKRLINFGMDKPGSIQGPGINAKMSELQAAMGLCVLDDMEAILSQRSFVWNIYERSLAGAFHLQARQEGVRNNYSYFPILFPSADQVPAAAAMLAKEGIQCRRYFYPSLDTLEHLGNPQEGTQAQQIANRILCLPVYASMSVESAQKVAGLLLNFLSSKAFP